MAHVIELFVANHCPSCPDARMRVYEFAATREDVLVFEHNVDEHLDAAAAREKDTDRPIRPIRLQSLDDVTKCHVIFLPKSHARQGAVLRRAAGKPILMIGDADGFLERGGHVRFESEPSQTRLRISVENLKASGLTGRSQLLRLAAQ